jgi:hypothetical protein
VGVAALVIQRVQSEEADRLVGYFDCAVAPLPELTGRYGKTPQQLAYYGPEEGLELARG